MKLKVDRFCNLTSSPSWQAWLYHFDNEIFRKFNRSMNAARNCTQKSQVMMDTVASIEAIHDGTNRLTKFLLDNYPHVLDTDQEPLTPRTEQKPVDTQIFPGYIEGLLTYPRRTIITGERLKKKVNDFLVDKIKSDFLIQGGKAYVEYLTRDDAAIADKIPIENWMIAKYRLRNG